MRKRWLGLLLAGMLVLTALALWFIRENVEPTTEIYRQTILETLRGKGIDPGLSMIIKRLLADLNCQDESLCVTKENFAYALDLTQEYEIFLADYLGRLCHSEKVQPHGADRNDHEQLCASLEKLFKETESVKTNASLGFQLSQSNNALEAKSVLQGVLKRMFIARERMSSINASLHQIAWLAPIWKDQQRLP